MIKDLDDKLIIITIYVALGASAKQPAPVNGYLSRFSVLGLVRIEGSRPDIINMLDQLLKCARLVQGKLDRLSDGAIIPALHGRVALMKNLPNLFAAFRIGSCEGTNICKLIRKPKHFNANVRTVFEDL